MGKLIGFIITIIFFANIIGVDFESFKEDAGEVVKSPAVQEMIKEGSKSLVNVIKKGEQSITKVQEIPVKTVKKVDIVQNQPAIVPKIEEIPVKTAKKVELNEIESDDDSFFDNTGWE
ncbi:MAG: hypothetical protein GY870_14120 [archaeon]|nr:hypothetical protein [archaeon]